MTETPIHALPEGVPDNKRDGGWGIYKRRLFVAVGVVFFLWLLAGFVSATVSILLLLFLCALIAIGLHGISSQVSKHTPVSDKLALALVVLAGLALIAGVILLVGPRLAESSLTLGATLKNSLTMVEAELRKYSWGEQLLNQLPTNAQIGSSYWEVALKYLRV